MFGICYYNEYNRKENYEWFMTKEEAIEAAKQAKQFSQIADFVTDEEWLERDYVTFIISYPYEEIKEYF